jgi:LysR family glycine cleavage system transcriptional activator
MNLSGKMSSPEPSTTFHNLMVAASSSEGVLLGRSALVSADLAAGRLVRPFDLALKSRWRYYVVYPHDALRQKKVKAFRDWPFAEMKSGEQRPEVR